MKIQFMVELNQFGAFFDFLDYNPSIHFFPNSLVSFLIPFWRWDSTRGFSLRILIPLIFYQIQCTWMIDDVFVG